MENVKRFKSEKEFTVTRQGFIITGAAEVVINGYNGRSIITMETFKVDCLSEIKGKINDAKFGVKTIIGAICHIYDYFPEIEGRRYRRTIFINKDGVVSKGFKKYCHKYQYQ